MIYMFINYGSAIALTIVCIAGFIAVYQLHARKQFLAIYAFLLIVAFGGLAIPVPSTPYLSIRMAVLRLILCFVAFTVWDLVASDKRETSRNPPRAVPWAGRRHGD